MQPQHISALLLCTQWNYGETKHYCVHSGITELGKFVVFNIWKLLFSLKLNSNSNNIVAMADDQVTGISKPPKTIMIKESQFPRSGEKKHQYSLLWRTFFKWRGTS